MHSMMMIKQILSFNKKAFDDSFKAVIVVGEHSEKMLRDFWEKSTLFPDQGKNVFGDWVDTYKKGLDDFKANVDSRFKLVEDYLLNAMDQMESSLDKVVKQTVPAASTDDQITKKGAVTVKKTVPDRPVVKKEKISRSKKIDK